MCNRDNTHSINRAEDWRFHGTGAVLGGVRHARRCASSGAGERSVQAAVEFHSCSALAVGTAAEAGAASGVCLLSAGGRSSSRR